MGAYPGSSNATRSPRRAKSTGDEIDGVLRAGRDDDVGGVAVDATGAPDPVGDRPAQLGMARRVTAGRGATWSAVTTQRRHVVSGNRLRSGRPMRRSTPLADGGCVT